MDELCLSMFLIVFISSVKMHGFARDFSSVQNGRVETWDLPSTFPNTRYKFQPSPH